MYYRNNIAPFCVRFLILINNKKKKKKKPIKLKYINILNHLLKYNKIKYILD